MKWAYNKRKSSDILWLDPLRDDWALPLLAEEGIVGWYTRGGLK